MPTLILLQAGVPLLLVAWLAVKPPRSRVARLAHSVAAGAWLLAAELTGLWTVLPWWTPHALAVALIAVAAWRLAPRSLPMRPAGWRAWAGTGLALAVTVAAAVQVVFALRGRDPPPGPVAELASPFADGAFLVVNGGSNAGVNAHLRTLVGGVPRYRDWRGQSHAVDLVGIRASGLRAGGLRPADPAAYTGFGARILAPCDGTVVRAVDGIADNIVPRTNRDEMAGNHVLLRCGEFEVLLAHLRRGSVEANEGERVTRGMPVGELGNSGNSDEPHLHVHAQRPSTVAGAPFAGDPVPVRIDGRYLVRNDRLRGRSAAVRRTAPAVSAPARPR